MPSKAYKRFVDRVWVRMQERTDPHSVYYSGSDSLTSYCPACRLGTLRLVFLEHPRPGFTIDSEAGGPRRCSRGCTEDAIREALFA